MEIRATSKDYKLFEKLYTNKRDDLTLTKDDTNNFSVIMVLTEEGSFKEWTRGRANITSYLKYGYVRIRKQCPYRHRKCIAEKCALYVISAGTGDCAHVWNFYKP